MKNFVQPGNVLTFTAPSGGVVAGTPYLIGKTLCVATQTVAQTLPFEGAVKGVFTFPKEGAGSAQAWVAGDLLYWDDTNHRLTVTSASNTLAAKAAADALTTATTGDAMLID